MLKRRLTPGHIISAGFAAVILIGAVLLMLPVSVNKGVRLTPIDAFFTSTSAVCVTGLIAVDAADTFTVFGRIVLAVLIQTGGLGITSIGVGIIMLSGKKINMRERVLVKEALNYNSFKGVLSLVKSVLIMTLGFELCGMLLSLMVFARDYPFWDAVGISAFHAVAAFNNSGFDILGGLRNLIPYQNDVLLNLTTCMLIIFGGLGFFVIREIITKRSFRRFSLHTKVVITVSVSLLITGTLFLKATEDITWLGAFFFSTSARTAGFSTYPLGGFSNAGLFVLIVLMFIGASPGSTGGGIKTTTFSVLLCALLNASKSKLSIFKRKLPAELLHKALIITLLALTVVIVSTFLLCVSEPDTNFVSLLFEAVSAFGTVGLSTGITPGLTVFGKTVLIFTMFVGRLGPLTIASLLIIRPEPAVSYAEESMAVG
ncbi:MAG: potassium transporter TrkG [Eubacteriales bacterium]|nr:potassium transporter TrkG [Eubacteriales bacterium]